MDNNKQIRPGCGCTASLLTVMIIFCFLIIFFRSMCISYTGCGQCGTCSASVDTTIDTSDYIDVYFKNNIDLVKWAQNAYESEWGYVYGTWGNVLTDDLLRQKAAQYRADVAENEDFIRRHWMNGRVTDCVGLIKGYCWYSPPSGFVYQGNGMPDIGANGMFDNAAEKGEIDSIPEIPGLAVWVKGHIGVYIGDGWVIEAMSTLDGVQKTRLDDRPWTHWLEIPYIDYIDYYEEAIVSDS